MVLCLDYIHYKTRDERCVYFQMDIAQIGSVGSYSRSNVISLTRQIREAREFENCAIVDGRPSHAFWGRLGIEDGGVLETLSSFHDTGGSL